MSEVSWPDQRNWRVSLIGSLRVREFIGLWSLIKRLCFDIRAGIWNFLTHTDFPGLSGFGFLNVRLAIFSFTCPRTKIICHRVYGRLVQQLFVHAICHSDLFISFYNDCAQSKEKDFNVFLFFCFSFLHFLQMMSSEHLTCGWLQQLLLVLVKLGFTFAGPLRPLIGTECTAKSPASYILVFTGHWSPQAFPKQYPLFRPPAQWSKLIGEKDPWGWKHRLLENHPC